MEWDKMGFDYFERATEVEKTSHINTSEFVVVKRVDWQNMVLFFNENLAYKKQLKTNAPVLQELITKKYFDEQQKNHLLAEKLKLVVEKLTRVSCKYNDTEMIDFLNKHNFFKGIE